MGTTRRAVVCLESGLVEELTSDTLTSDFPLDGADELPGAAIDAAGHLLYRSRGGQTHVCMAMGRALGERTLADRFLVARSTQRDANGWSPLELSTLEPL